MSQTLPRIRIAVPADAEGVHAIYAPVVRDTSISFETDDPGVDEMRARIVKTLPLFPWLVAEDAEGVAGYVYAGRYAERAAYRWSATVSVYVHPRWHGRGLGRQLYRDLLHELTELGYCQAFAGITLPNAASVALHESVGFRPVGVYPRAGHKLGRWHDVGWWQRPLQSPDTPPEPRAFAGDQPLRRDRGCAAS